MGALDRLVNQKVIATIEGDKKKYDIEGTVIGVEVNDFYFYEKGETIFVTVSVNPTDEIPEELDIEQFHEISLDSIRKA